MHAYCAGEHLRSHIQRIVGPAQQSVLGKVHILRCSTQLCYSEYTRKKACEPSFYLGTSEAVIASALHTMLYEALGMPPAPQEPSAAPQHQANVIHPEKEHAGKTCDVQQDGTDARSTVLPARPLATIKAASSGKVGSSSGEVQQAWQSAAARAWRASGASGRCKYHWVAAADSARHQAVRCMCMHALGTAVATPRHWSSRR